MQKCKRNKVKSFFVSLPVICATSSPSIQSHVSHPASNKFDMSSTTSRPSTPGLPHSKSPARTPVDLDFLSGIELQIFRDATNNYKTNGHFLREDALALHWIFGPVMDQALELVDEDRVTVLQSKISDKVLIQVYGMTHGHVYYIPPGKAFCQCPLLRGGKKVKRKLCKHVLAAHITLAIFHLDEYEEIADSEMDRLIRINIRREAF